jgi:hypothetical protein
VIVTWVIIWTLVGILIIPATLLLVPVSFSGQAGLDESASFKASLAWAGGLSSLQAAATGGQPLEIRLHFGRWNWPLQPGQQKNPGKQSKALCHDSVTEKFVVPWIEKVNPYVDQQVFTEVFRFLFLLERSLDLKLSFEGEVGFSDPDLTGYLTGFLATLNSGQWECDLQPNFTDTVLHFRGIVQGRVLPVNLIWLTGRLLLSEPIRKIWWSQLRKTRIKPDEVVSQ